MYFQTPMVQRGAGQKFHAALVSTGPNIYHDTLTYIRPITTGAVDINLKNRFFFVRVTIYISKTRSDRGKHFIYLD